MELCRVKVSTFEETEISITGHGIGFEELGPVMGSKGRA